MPPYPDGFEVADFGMGCFWGAEKEFWSMPGVWVTAVGYQGGTTPNATYKEACSGRTGHAEVVRVVFDPSVVTYERLLKTFWENHDPTQGFRQGNDIGTQYRSAIFAHGEAQLAAANASRDMFEQQLGKSGYGTITTEIREAPAFYFAEEYHQQYLSKVPNGYCPNHATGVTLPSDFVGHAARVRGLARELLPEGGVRSEPTIAALRRAAWTRSERTWIAGRGPQRRP